MRGQIAVTFALACVAIFAVVALAIDGARVLVEQRGLQNGLDGAALTGALDLGPGAGSDQTSWALDDTVYAVERTLGIDFSNNYAAPSPFNVGHRLLGGATACSPNACTASSPAPGPGPYNPSNAASPCCNNWVDRSGAYTLTITTPYNYKNTGEDEAFIYVRLTHQLPLVFTAALFPSIGVTVTSIGRNHAIPYAIFAFKHNDDHDISTYGFCLRGAQAEALVHQGEWEEAVAISMPLLESRATSPANRHSTTGSLPVMKSSSPISTVA